MASGRMPQNMQALDVTVREMSNGSVMLWVGEHFNGKDEQDRPLWRAGTRAFHLDITDPDNRELAIVFLERLVKIARTALKEHPAKLVRTVTVTTAAPWYQEYQAAKSAKPAPKAAPAPAPAPKAAPAPAPDADTMDLFRALS